MSGRQTALTLDYAVWGALQQSTALGVLCMLPVLQLLGDAYSF